MARLLIFGPIAVVIPEPVPTLIYVVPSACLGAGLIAITASLQPFTARPDAMGHGDSSRRRRAVSRERLWAPAGIGRIRPPTRIRLRDRRSGPAATDSPAPASNASVGS